MFFEWFSIAQFWVLLPAAVLLHGTQAVQTYALLQQEQLKRRRQ